MLFRSRKKVKFIEKIYAFLWPKSGWNRLIKYISLRIKRLPGSPHKIALGFSFGIMSAMTPFFGVHFLIGIFCSWLFGASIAASIIGNFIGNPWTFPFIILLNYKIGNYIFNSGEAIPFNIEIVYNEFILILSSMLSILIDGNVNNFLNSLEGLYFLPTILYGSLFTCIISAVISYIFIKNIVINYQKRRFKLTILKK